MLPKIVKLILDEPQIKAALVKVIESYQTERKPQVPAWREIWRYTHNEIHVRRMESGVIALWNDEQGVCVLRVGPPRSDIWYEPAPEIVTDCKFFLRYEDAIAWAMTRGPELFQACVADLKEQEIATREKQAEAALKL